MSEVKAWQLEVAPGVHVLLARQSLGHLLNEYSLGHVPLAPLYADKVLFWHDAILPVVNLAGLVAPEWLSGQGDDYLELDAPQDLLLGIVAYRYQGEIHQGGLMLYSPPVLVDVPDEIGEWPESQVPWEQLSLTCVHIQGNDLPLLNLDYLLTQAIESSELE